MRVLVDIVHPAHVHFYRHLITQLEARGDEVEVVARDKDVTLELLDLFEIPYRSVGRSGSKGWVGQASELLIRDWALWRTARRFRPHLILARNPAGVQVARVVGAIGVFDTDDGSAVGIHFRAAAPFAHVITTPDSITEDYGPRHRRYQGYKALAYLHPAHFRPDPDVLTHLGVSEDEPYSLVRFVAMVASHDRNEAGLALDVKRRIVNILDKRGRVFISSEAGLPSDLETRRLQIPPHRMHDALAFARMCVGDSQTVAFEAGLLGTPSIHCSSWSGRLEPLDELERRFGLLRSFPPERSEELLAAVEEVAADPDAKLVWAGRRERMLREKIDVTAWYLDLVSELAP